MPVLFHASQITSGNKQFRGQRCIFYNSHRSFQDPLYVYAILNSRLFTGFKQPKPGAIRPVHDTSKSPVRLQQRQNNTLW